MTGDLSVGPSWEKENTNSRNYPPEVAVASVYTHKKIIEEELMASILSLLPDCTWSDQLVHVPAAVLPPPRWPVTSSCEPEWARVVLDSCLVTAPRQVTNRFFLCNLFLVQFSLRTFPVMLLSYCVSSHRWPQWPSQLSFSIILKNFDISIWML